MLVNYKTVNCVSVCFCGGLDKDTGVFQTQLILLY